MGTAMRGYRAPENAGPDEADKKLRNTVQSLAKGFKVLEAFDAEHEEMSLSQIALKSKLDPGTTFRMLNTLVDLGYVSRVPDSRRFRLTLKVLDLGFHAIAHRDWRTSVRPVLRTLVSDLSEAASFAVLQGPDVLYIERVRAGVTRLGVDIRIGTTVPTLRTAVGMAILAFLSAAELERVLAAAQVQDEAVEGIKQRLVQVREQGYILQNSLLTEGLRILAVPVLDADGYPLGAISVAAPSVRCTDDYLRDNALQPTRLAAAEVAKAIQASGSVAATLDKS